jgi:hypothetical protein
MSDPLKVCCLFNDFVRRKGLDWLAGVHCLFFVFLSLSNYCAAVVKELKQNGIAIRPCSHVSDLCKETMLHSLWVPNKRERESTIYWLKYCQIIAA